MFRTFVLIVITIASTLVPSALTPGGPAKSPADPGTPESFFCRCYPLVCRFWR